MQKPSELAALVPSHISPIFARDLSLCLTGLTRETNLVRYMALALLYLSWHFDGAAPVSAYQAALKELPDDDGASLLENLVHPPAYSRRGKMFDIPHLEIRAAQGAAQGWKASLTRKGLNPLRMHKRSLDIFSALSRLELAVFLTGEPPAQLGRLHDFLATQAYNENPLSGPPLGRPVSTVSEFESAVSALQYLMDRSLERQAQLAEQSPDSPDTVDAQDFDEPLDFRAAQVYDPVDAMAVLQRMSATATPEGNAQHRQLLENMVQSSGNRCLTEFGKDQSLDELYLRFPHFKEPLDYVAGALALAACGEAGRPVLIPPMLLRGPPGTGKSYFARELARVLGVQFVTRDLSVTSEAFVISGLDAGWKNAKQGLVFDALVNGHTANPLICLDEIDKCRSTSSHNSPIASLYSLLEPASSRSFVDEFAAVPVDASRVSWVLTSNDGDIPEPILSRLEQFDISPPSLAQCRAIAQSVWQALTTQDLPHGHGFAEVLSDEALTYLGALSPRLMRKALVHAVSTAAKQERKALEGQDVQAGISRYTGGLARRSIGFSANF
jgi:ATP-dependent Lon protease